MPGILLLRLTLGHRGRSQIAGKGAIIQILSLIVGKFIKFLFKSNFGLSTCQKNELDYFAKESFQKRTSLTYFTIYW